MRPGQPPPEDGPSTVVLKMWSVPQRGIITVRFLGEMKATLTHWLNIKPKGRGVVCLGEKCDAKLHKLKAIWKGYAPVEIARVTERDWYPGVIEITSALGQQLEGRRLTGEIWDLERHPGEFKHPEAVGTFIRVERPAPIDARTWVDTVCFRLYFTTEIIWGAKDPLPGRVRLATRPLSPERPLAAPEEPTATPEKPTNGTPRKAGKSTWEMVPLGKPSPT